MIESYNAWIVFKCCESIKETKLTVDIWTAENPPAWNDFCFRKASPARTAFDLQSDEGYVSKGQLLWMLADSGMPVNKAGWRLLRCKKKKSGGGPSPLKWHLHLHLFVSVVVLLEHPIGQNLNKFSNSEAWQKHRFCKMEYMFHLFFGLSRWWKRFRKKKNNQKTETYKWHDLSLRDRRGCWATFKILTSSGLQTDCSTDRRAVEEIYT